MRLSPLSMTVAEALPKLELKPVGRKGITSALVHYSAFGTLETFYSQRSLHIMTYYVVGVMPQPTGVPAREKNRVVTRAAIAEKL